MVHVISLYVQLVEQCTLTYVLTHDPLLLCTLKVLIANNVVTVSSQDMWLGLLHHVTGEHQWALDACHHGPLDDSRDKNWLEADSMVHQRLREIILDKRWLKNIEKYLYFR